MPSSSGSTQNGADEFPRQIPWMSVSLVLLVLLFATFFSARAQQSPPARQEVRDNLAPHPAPMQPVPFSHKTHVTRGLKCQNCHTNPDPGNQMTIPQASMCMTCHVTVAKDQPNVQRLAEVAKSGQPIPWVRIYQVTPGVTWTHRAHLQAGMQCIMCHGNVGEVDAMAENTSVTAMGSCIGCHQAHNAPTVCSTCHSWPAS